jgi:hypothetical protein
VKAWELWVHTVLLASMVTLLRTSVN